MKLFNTNHTIMEQLTAMLEGMTTRYMSGEERADKEKLAGHVATMRPREVDGLWLELKEAANAPREMQERIKKLEEAMPKFQEQGVSFGRFWISYDKLVGCDWNPGANRDAFWRENVFAKNLHQWLADHHPEVFTTPSTII